MMLALDARFRLRRGSTERWLSAADFFTGLFSTALAVDELLVEIEIPSPPARTGWSFQEVSRRHGDFALAGVAAGVTLSDDGNCVGAVIALLALGERRDARRARERPAGRRPRARWCARSRSRHGCRSHRRRRHRSVTRHPRLVRLPASPCRRVDRARFARGDGGREQVAAFWAVDPRLTARAVCPATPTQNRSVADGAVASGGSATPSPEQDRCRWSRCSARTIAEGGWRSSPAGALDRHSGLVRPCPLVPGIHRSREGPAPPAQAPSPQQYGMGGAVEQARPFDEQRASVQPTGFVPAPSPQQKRLPAGRSACPRSRRRRTGNPRPPSARRRRCRRSRRRLHAVARRQLSQSSPDPQMPSWSHASTKQIRSLRRSALPGQGALPAGRRPRRSSRRRCRTARRRTPRRSSIPPRSRRRTRRRARRTAPGTRSSSR